MKNRDHHPFQHQLDTTRFLLFNKRAFVLSDMGTGKTLCPLWATDFLMHNDKIKRVLIVSPLSTMQAVWGREIFQNLPHRKFVLAHGSADYRVKCINSVAEYVIINHDGVVMMENHLIKANFDVIVIDELTGFKNPSTNRTKAMQRIAAKAKGVWGMTGEPTPNSPVEAFGQARVVNPGNPALPRYLKQFKDLVEYEIAPYITVPKEDAAKHVFKVLQPAIRFTREQCIDIPDRFTNVIEVPFTEQQHIAYETMKKEFMIEYEQGLITAANAGVKAMKLLQISAGAVKDDDGKIMLLDDKPRMDMIEQTLDEMGRNRKLVVFSAFRASIEKLARHFTKQKLKLGVINGSVNQNVRGELIRNFQDEDLELLILQPQACAHGVTLTAANVVLWHSLVASGEIYNQANARISRIGQLRKQYVKIPWSSKAELKLVRLLENKAINSDAVLDLFTDL